MNKCKTRYYKILEENIGRTLFDINASNIFSQWSVRKRYSKSHSSSAKSCFSLHCLAGCGGGESLLVWLIEATCLSTKSLHPFSPEMSRKQSQHPDFGKLRADSSEGEPSAVSVSCPTWVSQARIILPGFLLPVILGAAVSFQVGLSLSPLPGSPPSLLTTP